MVARSMAKLHGAADTQNLHGAENKQDGRVELGLLIFAPVVTMPRLS